MDNIYKVTGRLNGGVFRFFVDSEDYLDAICGIREMLNKQGLKPSGISAVEATDQEIMEARNLHRRIFKVEKVGA